MDKKEYNLYLVGKPESSQYSSKRGGPSINDKCVYRLIYELKKKGIEVDLESSKASYVEPVSRFNFEEKRGTCCIAEPKELKEKYFFSSFLLKAGELGISLEDVSENGVEGIQCHLNFKDVCELGKRKILNDVKDVLTRFYGFECRDAK